MVGVVKDDAPGGGQVTEGSHAGSVYAQLVDSGLRDVTSDQIVREWREAVGPIAGVETLTVGSPSRGPGGKPIEFKLLGAATEMKQLEAAVEETRQKLVTEFSGRSRNWPMFLSVEATRKSIVLIRSGRSQCLRISVKKKAMRRKLWPIFRPVSCQSC